MPPEPHNPRRALSPRLLYIIACSAVFHGTVYLSFGLFLFDRLPLLVLFLPSRKADFDLGMGILEIDFQGYERISLLGGFAMKSYYLFFVKEQFPRP